MEQYTPAKDLDLQFLSETAEEDEARKEAEKKVADYNRRVKLQNEIYEYAFQLKKKNPKWKDARIRRKTEEYFKRSMAELGTEPST